MRKSTFTLKNPPITKIIPVAFIIFSYGFIYAEFAMLAHFLALFSALTMVPSFKRIDVDANKGISYRNDLLFWRNKDSYIPWERVCRVYFFSNEITREIRITNVVIMDRDMKRVRWDFWETGNWGEGLRIIRENLPEKSVFDITGLTGYEVEPIRKRDLKN